VKLPVCAASFVSMTTSCPPANTPPAASTAKLTFVVPVAVPAFSTSAEPPLFRFTSTPSCEPAPPLYAPVTVMLSPVWPLRMSMELLLVRPPVKRDAPLPLFHVPSFVNVEPAALEVTLISPLMTPVLEITTLPAVELVMALPVTRLPAMVGPSVDADRVALLVTEMSPVIADRSRPVVPPVTL
jgi:hypothetical protein